MSPCPIVDQQNRPLAGKTRIGEVRCDTQKYRPGTGFDLLELG
jgi:hypothetical protein